MLGLFYDIKQKTYLNIQGKINVYNLFSMFLSYSIQYLFGKVTYILATLFFTVSETSTERKGHVRWLLPLCKMPGFGITIQILSSGHLLH